MIVRFLDAKGRCCQVSTPQTSMLVYMNAAEKKQLIDNGEGQCLMMINSQDQEEIQKISVKLNTKEDPIQMK